MASHYAGVSVAFLTQHGKQSLVVGPLESALGCRVIHTDGFDTDRLGNFSRTIDRVEGQRETARRKALIGMDLLGTDVGIASEGAFGVDPHVGMLAWNVEILIWVDRTQGIEVLGVAQGPARAVSEQVKTADELFALAERAGFPEHQLMMRPVDEHHPDVISGLSTVDDLQRAFASCRDRATDGIVFVESDLRAFANPTRQTMIRAAADDLSRKLQSPCPQCDAPGFWSTGISPGLPCSRCGASTRLARAVHWGCVRCSFTQERPVERGILADPARCDACNP